MGVRQYKPTSAGRRGGAASDFSECTNPPGNAPAKALRKPHKKKGGPNNPGAGTPRFRGGGHKRMLRIVDFKRKKDGIAASVKSIEYDPGRSARIALIQYQDGEKAYILAPEGLKAGDTVTSGDAAEPRVGNCLPL